MQINYLEWQRVVFAVRAVLALGILLFFTSTALAIEVAMTNESFSTPCQEVDNVTMNLASSVVGQFDIVATHPVYGPSQFPCLPNFDNCGPPDPTCPDFPSQAACATIFDDNTYVVWSYRFGPPPYPFPCPENLPDFPTGWWRPAGMMTSGPMGTLPNAHIVKMSIKIAGEPSWPEVMVCYQDGNTRLKPHPPVGMMDVCFGTSVLVGPVGPSSCEDRPIAEISSIVANADRSLTVGFVGGGSAVYRVFADRTHALLRVEVNYPTVSGPFATFRSMFVTEAQSDAAWLLARLCGATVRNCPVLDCTSNSGDCPGSP